MSYIILNGVKSTELIGFMVQKLPPIVRPQIRTDIETIDGRDGDIVTKLGYAAYDREVLIGLYGNYELDRVIDFFDSEGTVTFSDEPDRYYRYQILEEIDWERLGRLRQATVVFHVQPFKYSLSEGDPEFFIKNNSEIRVQNSGNIYSKPKLTLNGSGVCRIFLNGSQVFSISFSSNDSVTIDTEAMEAYKGNTLRNRIVTGNYDKFYLPVGVNTIRFTGAVTKCAISNYSRWI